MSGTIGLRGGMELGADARLNGPDGTGIETSSQIGMEAYAEAGGTIGPDGLALGASAGSGVYASNTATLDGGDTARSPTATPPSPAPMPVPTPGATPPATRTATSTAGLSARMPALSPAPS